MEFCLPILLKLGSQRGCEQFAAQFLHQFPLLLNRQPGTDGGEGGHVNSSATCLLFPPQLVEQPLFGVSKSP